MSEELVEAPKEVAPAEEAKAVEAPAVEGPSSKFKEVRAAAEAAHEDRVASKSAVEIPRAMAIAAAAENLGIQNTLEVVEFGLALAKAIDAAKADGKIDLADIGQLFPLAPMVVPMVDGIGQIPKELGDLDEVELEVLLSKAAQILGGAPDAKTVLKVKAALKFAHAGYDLYKAFAA